ncbi:MAG: DNA cytosine methyltransferase, partial [Caulobacteraceae bacterium]
MGIDVATQRRFRVTALFGGVGGLELGLGHAGHEATSFCEIDPEAATVLARRFPSACLTRDIRRIDEVIDAIDSRSQLLTAG